MSERILLEHNYSKYANLKIIIAHYFIFFQSTGIAIRTFFFLRTPDDAQELRVEKKKILAENIKLTKENDKLTKEKKKNLIENGKLRRKIQSEDQKRRNLKQTILSLRKQINYFKKKIQRKEISLRKIRDNSLENSDLDVR